MWCGQFECNTSNVQTSSAQYFNSTNSTPCIDTDDNGTITWSDDALITTETKRGDYGEGRTKMSQKLALQLGVEANNFSAFERNGIR
jgi:hypothetical protein